MQPICFQSICSPQLYQYLGTKDKLKVSLLSHLIRALTLQSRNWGTIEIQDIYGHQHNYLQWLQKYIPIIKPTKLSIFSRNQSRHPSLLQLFTSPMPFVQDVDLYCESQEIHLAISLLCTNIKRITFRSHLFGDEIFSLMCKSLQNITQLYVIADDTDFTGAKLESSFLNCHLEKLVLKPHLLDFELLLAFLKRQPHLTQLELDIENCELETLIRILDTLNNIEVLRLYHMEYMSDHKRISSKLTNRITELTLTKTQRLPIHQIIVNVSSMNLLSLDLSEAEYLFDDQLEIIAGSAGNLKEFNVSWCKQITNKGISILFYGCLKLETVILNGVKSLDDTSFEQYLPFSAAFNEKHYDMIRANQKNVAEPLKINEIEDARHIKTLSNLQHLECCSCNKVSDKLLKTIAYLLKKAKVINYYSEHIELGYQE